MPASAEHTHIEVLTDREMNIHDYTAEAQHCFI